MTDLDVKIILPQMASKRCEALVLNIDQRVCCCEVFRSEPVAQSAVHWLALSVAQCAYIAEGRRGGASAGIANVPVVASHSREERAMQTTSC